LYGIDEKCGGTWLGVSKSGDNSLKFSAVTNYRAPDKIFSGALSRGEMVSDYLKSEDPGGSFIEKIIQNKVRYNPFNFLAYDKENMYWFSNMSENNRAEVLEPGVYGLCNSLLDTPWPKVEKSKKEFLDCIGRESIDTEALFDILTNRDIPPDRLLPDTGIGLTWERMLSPVFITSEVYGTRSSSLVMIDYNGKVDFIERTWIKGMDDTFSHQNREMSL
jgi:uncharacterized protein with NRDE domain